MIEYAAFNQEAFRKWGLDKGDITHRLNYNLNENSVIFDIGGYKGECTQNLFNKYKSTIYVFEPIKEYFQELEKRFKDNPKIKCFNFGLGAKDEFVDIFITENSSTIFSENGEKEKIEIKSLSNFLTENNIQNIALAEVNIEGAEYELLEDLIQNKKMEIFKNIQIQFHRNIPDCIDKRLKIREELSKTHTIIYDYEFIWEGWTKKQTNI